MLDTQHRDLASNQHLSAQDATSQPDELDTLLAAARERARAAFFAGDRKSYDWWREICRLLDQRLALNLNAETIDTTLHTPA